MSGIRSKFSLMSGLFAAAALGNRFGMSNTITVFTGSREDIERDAEELRLAAAAVGADQPLLVGFTDSDQSQPSRDDVVGLFPPPLEVVQFRIQDAAEFTDYSATPTRKEPFYAKFQKPEKKNKRFKRH